MILRRNSVAKIHTWKINDFGRLYYTSSCWETGRLYSYSYGFKVYMYMWGKSGIPIKWGKRGLL